MVKVREDLTGKVFGRLTVIKQAEDYVSPLLCGHAGVSAGKKKTYCKQT